MTRFSPALVAVAVLALAGCGANGTAATSASASPQSAKATVTEYASLVAKEHFYMGTLLDEMLSSACDWTTPGNVDARPGYTICSTGVQTIGSHARQLTIALKGPATPPDEIRWLVNETWGIADMLASMSEAATPCTTAAASADCRTKLSKFHDTLIWMQAQFAAWGPYGI